ncbi:MAG: type II toxin-antitoxin system RelE/ParE family toxin [Novosphingobium sp.]
MTRRIDKPKNVLYKGQAFSLEETLDFAKWLAALRDRKAKAMIADRLKRAANGNFGKIRSVQGGVFEMKIDHGPGYRVYYFQRGKELVILLCGGDKRTQNADIAHAKRLKEEIERRGGDKAL